MRLSLREKSIVLASISCTAILVAPVGQCRGQPSAIAMMRIYCERHQQVEFEAAISAKFRQIKIPSQLQQVVDAKLDRLRQDPVVAKDMGGRLTIELREPWWWLFAGKAVRVRLFYKRDVVQEIYCASPAVPRFSPPALSYINLQTCLPRAEKSDQVAVVVEDVYGEDCKELYKYETTVGAMTREAGAVGAPIAEAAIKELADSMRRAKCVLSECGREGGVVCTNIEWVCSDISGQPLLLELACDGIPIARAGIQNINVSRTIAFAIANGKFSVEGACIALTGIDGDHWYAEIAKGACRELTLNVFVHPDRDLGPPNKNSRLVISMPVDILVK